MAVIRDENGHLQPDYNYRRPSDNPDARELEKYRYGERPSREEYPNQSSYATPFGNVGVPAYGYPNEYPPSPVIDPRILAEEQAKQDMLYQMYLRQMQR